MIFSLFPDRISLIWAVTFILVITTDLLTGVLVGLALSAVELFQHRRSLRLKVDEEETDGARRVSLEGSATFVSLTRLTHILERIPVAAIVHLDLHRLRGIDHTSAEMMREWVVRRKVTGQPVVLAGPDDIVARLAPAH